MSQYSPRSPLEFLFEEKESEEIDTVTDDQQPESAEIEEEAANDNQSTLSPFLQKRSSEKNSTMDPESASGSGSSSGNQLGKENGSENSSTHTSCDSTSAQEPPSRSVFSLKPRSLKMKDISSTPELPAKRPCDNPVEEDDSPMQEMKREERKGQNDNYDDDEEPRNDSNNPLFRRLSSDEAEEDSAGVAILKGILDYYSKNGEYPFANSSAMTDFIKNSIGQLKDSIPELMAKEVMGPHDEAAIELSKKICGNEQKNADHLNQLDEEKKGTKAGEEELDLSMYPFLKESLDFCKKFNALAPNLAETTVEAGLGLIGNSKVKELDEKWRKLKVEELELLLKRVGLIKEQTMLIIKAIKSSSLH